MKRLLILLFVLISLGSFGQGRIVVKVPSVTIPSSLPSQTGNAGKVLTTDGSSVQWTGTAKYSFTNLQDGQLIKAQISGGDTTFVNFTPNYVTQTALDDSLQDIRSSMGTGSPDSIRVASSVPETGNVYINNTDHRLYYKSGLYWYKVAVEDSALAAGGGGSGILEAVPFPTVNGTFSESPAGTWTSSAGDGYALSSIHLGGDGYVQMDYNGASNETAVLGLDEGNALERYATNLSMGNDQYNYNFMVYVYTSTIYIAYPGNNTATSVGTVSAGDKLRLERTGSTVRAQKSTDGTNWSTLHTFANTSASSLYIKTTIVIAGNSLLNPKVYNGNE